MAVRNLIDGRNLLEGRAASEAGFTYRAMGAPAPPSGPHRRGGRAGREDPATSDLRQLLCEVFGRRDGESAGEPFTHVRGREAVHLRAVAK
jgi:hypothetical protein